MIPSLYGSDGIHAQVGNWQRFVPLAPLVTGGGTSYCIRQRRKKTSTVTGPSLRYLQTIPCHQGISAHDGNPSSNYISYVTSMEGVGTSSPASAEHGRIVEGDWFWKVQYLPCTIRRILFLYLLIFHSA